MSVWGQVAGPLLVQGWDPGDYLLPDHQLGARQAAAQGTQKMAKTKIQGQAQSPALSMANNMGLPEWQ